MPPKVDARPNFQTASLRISGDGSKVFLQDCESIQAWSIWTGEVVGKVVLENNQLAGCLMVDGSRVWVSFGDLQSKGWDFGIPGSIPIPLSSAPPSRPSLDFIHNAIGGTKIHPPRIEDTVTGKEVF